ncbi:hypothetical protein [Gaiella sp.]|uniref:hypothetical protein n=1 Tax=Gaiella sp. TaxID=2663207 RepID=UPI00398364EB
MVTESGDPHAIETALVGEDEYQAPPREDSQPQRSSDDDGALQRSEDRAPEPPIDINLLESQQQKPGLQTLETIVVDPSEKKEFTVSGPDEETQPGGSRAVPPGESM